MTAPDLADDVGFRALVTGVVAGALMKAGSEFLSIDVEVPVAKDGNYETRVYVTGRESGTKLVVDVQFADVA